MNIHVIVPVYNRPDLLRRCLSSIGDQRPAATSVTVSDDASTDAGVAEVMDEADTLRPDWLYRRNTENIGATRNIVESIRAVEMDSNDVILLVDGDDRLPHPHVIGRLRKVYSDPHVLASYGSYESDPPDENCPVVKALPRDILTYGMARAFTRDHGQWFNHPISFRRRIFDILNDDDFTIDGEWMRYGYDVTIFVPILEIVGKRVAYVKDVLYTYTSDRPESVARAHPEETSRENDWVTSQPRRRAPL